jgi:CRISPR-associated protein Csb2
MSGLTIGWEYLTGCCVATDPASRQRAEWPPHPGRVFMAMAAAWFETGEDEAEGQALRWLEKLGDPELGLPDFFSTREVVDCYVPVNDVAGPSKAILQSAPGFTRERKERTFPSVWVGDAPCFLHWPNADTAGVELHQSALDQLCGKVTRIGHSSSLVRMWVAEEVSSAQPTETWVPDDGLADLQARRFTEGTLDLLDRQFNRRGREQHQLLSDRIAALKAEKRATTGKGSQQRKAELDVQVAAAESQMKEVDPRDPIRPKLGLWTGYRRKEAKLPPSIPHANFDSDLLILTQVDGPRLPLASTLAVTRALRGAVMSHSAVQPPPSWVSGHLEDCQPLRDGQQHLAFIALPFVGHEHADGHLLGVGLVFPRSVPRPERGRVLGRFLVSETGQPRDVELTLGRLGVWTVRKRDWMEHRQALQPETWTAHPRGATTWASVTPVVLDRFPKCDPFEDREAWQDEVAGIVAIACERLGLPAPIEVAVGTTSWHRGSPRATVKRRPLRGHPEIPDTCASLGDGFPIYPTKGGNGARPQLHVWLKFAEPVVGPILLCAGRFFGYGLCKPLWEGGIP